MGPGQAWGPYTLERSLGRGAHGEVYLAIDRDNDEPVALKVLTSRDPLALEGFKNEVRLLTDVAHPGLVVPDELVARDGALALVMPFVDGRPFTTALAEAAGPPELGALADEDRARRLVARLVEAVEGLHARGLVHLDIKPANVLVTHDDQVELLDFGLSRLAEDEAPFGAIVGTPAWMAPEQLTLGALSGATDLYAIGLLVFEALAHAPPFDARDGLNARLLRAPPTLATLRPGVPATWSELVAGLLQIRPDARPSVPELLARLAAETRPAGRITPPFVGRRPELAALARAWERVRSGLPAMALVRGAAGAGKSALVRRFVTFVAEAGARVVAGRCNPVEALPFKALDAVLDQLASLVRARADLRALVSSAPERHALARVFPAFGEVAGAPATPQPGDSQNARALLRRIVDRIAQTEPLVIVIDDVHWGDADAVEVLVALLEPPDAPRVFVVATHRDGAAWAEAPFAAALEHRAKRGLPFPVVTLDVGPLDPADAQVIAGALDAPESRAALVAAARGNALVLTQLLAAPELGAAGLDAVIAARLERLDPSVRMFVAHVALAAGALPPRVLAAAAGVRVPGRATLRELGARGLVQTIQQRMARVVLVHHDLVRPAIIRAAFDDTSRRAAHLALARAIVDADGDPGLVAHHFAAGAAPGEAARWALIGADLAERASAFARTADLLSLARASGATGPELERRLAAALRDAGRGHEAVAVYEGLAARAGRATERRAHLRAAGEALLVRGEIAGGLERMRPIFDELGLAPEAGGARRALSLATHLGALVGKRMGLPVLGADPRAAERFDTCWAVGKAFCFTDPMAGLDFLLRALAYAHASGDRQRIARVTGPIAGFVLGNLPGMLPRAERWVAALATQGDDPYYAGAHALWSAYLAATRGQLVATATYAAAAMDRLTGVPDTEWERVQALSALARALFGRGHFGTLDGVARAHQPDIDRRRDLAAMVMMASYRLVPALVDGRPDEASDVASWVVATWLPERYSPQRFYALRAARMIELAAGRPDVAARALVSGRKDFERAGGYRIVVSRLDHDLLEARTVLALGRNTPTGLLALPRLVKRLDDLAIPEGPAHAALVRAATAWHSGDDDGARDGFRRARVLLDSANVDAEAAVARLRLAELDGLPSEAERARRAMRQLGIRDPDAWAALVTGAHAPRGRP